MKNPSQRHCEKLLRKLSDFLDGELSSKTEKEVEEHLKECLHCLASYRSLKWSVEALRRFPSQPIPRRIRDQVRRQILREIGQDQ